ncbi:murein DD-endopeptidase MepM/ murein hydrolase activator NlpD [Rhizobium leguminosarum]|uniref:Murein DD-endopeptidase MepM/ murein hydrolase activator NlpD n=1 Tax=Rhizobium leguminosarum TaxID=384 RepID=A0AAE2SW67_RHILE|nr:MULTISPECIES: peptidoglycan DD-metalloendopeptidase family protein [Rhizobium]MBB4290200.1 murein DD-endopeptidase MepM/ murein hydrolase activator NlpD [Rhizobium leguminosarum]MBB4296843.1 murein DD-endopeptidase MepM/ murein hydrolase activator NlpD [Rhizobium leguminosarum]MBB4307895.1 murein DD-endopeptidase MepM/ murein hydrolase activator NlpD [Rhizobium leguminosarum]MBB4415731.1 murein DD-endopeptidase MepM/ murein hydrolase activator NlpD [Rhizobium leguminosarum]MBB4431302.1 mure
MNSGHQHRVFGRRAQEHILILASGDKVRHMTVRPWMAALAFCLVGVFSIGYLLATSYLVLRDDLIGATMARQARMQHDYEDRIAALRAQVDRITSRQLLDQQVVEDKVDKLMEQQMALTSRHGKLDNLLDRAESSGLTDKDSAPSSPVQSFAPDIKDKRASLSGGGIEAIEKQLASGPPADATPDNSTLAYVPSAETVGDRADRIFSKVTLSLKGVEQDQRNRVEQLTSDAGNAANAIATVLTRFKIPMPAETAARKDDDDAVGGPYVEPESNDDFNNSLVALDGALTRLEAVRSAAESLPFRNPAVGKEVTSPFGNRRDPFLGRLALHSGIDFRFSPGERIRPTAPGKVIAAGWTGGYGNMVEVDHGNGISTRYGHMSEVLVKVGDTVGRNDVIGLAGSTGRSTGTHLHYEVRQDGHAVDPVYFMNAGLKLATYIK